MEALVGLVFVITALTVQAWERDDDSEDLL